MLLEIHRATKLDAPVVEALFRAHLRGLGAPPDRLLDRDMAGFPEFYEQPGACFLVAAGEGTSAVAMAGLADREIRRVFVEPRWRGQGIATRLVLALIAWAEGLHLETAVAQGGGPERRPDLGAEGAFGAPRTAAMPQAPLDAPVDSAPSRPLETERLRAVVARENAASRRLFLGCGFRATGQAPNDPAMSHCEVFELRLRERQ